MPKSSTKMPVWDRKDLATGLISYTCPRRDCGKVFYTGDEDDIDSPTTGCPHCHKYARIEK